MKTSAKLLLIALFAGVLMPGMLPAQTVSDAWHAKTLGGALGLTALFGVSGVVLAILGYKLFDLCTPGELHKEIIENKNVAAAIVGGAIIVGVCIIIAAAILG
jgi:uncharacterized membrane protein YjfL (UPF0719 family)